MKSDADWSDVRQDMVCDHGDYVNCSDCEKSFIRQVQADALQHALNLALLGKIAIVQNELDRGLNLGLAVMVEDLEKLVKETEEGK